MTALDRLTPDMLAEIRERDERSLRRAEDPAWSLGQAEFDRAVLLVEVDRLSAYCNSIDRLNEVADADWKQEVERLKAERDKAAGSAKHMGDAMTKVGTVMQSAARTAVELGAHAGMDVIVGYLSDANMLPPDLLDGGAS